jgi:hypothetical protein
MNLSLEIETDIVIQRRSASPMRMPYSAPRLVGEARVVVLIAIASARHVLVSALAWTASPAIVARRSAG